MATGIAPKIAFLVAGLTLASSLVTASIPEPSNILHGELYTLEKEGDTAVLVKNAGIRIYAKKNQIEIADTELDADGTYTLEIPIEVDLGQSSADKARLNDTIQIYVSGQQGSVSSFRVANRGVVIERKLYTTHPIDSDGDGIPDYKDPEPNNPNSPIAYGGGDDIDGDGESNASEYLNSPQGYDPLADFDGDGFRNTDEYRLGSNPADENSYPLNHIVQGSFAPIAINKDIDFINGANSVEYTIPASWGSVKDISLVHWHLNGSPDLMVAADEIHLIKSSTDFTLANNEEVQLTLSGLPQLSAFNDYRIGYSDFIGDGILEFWVHTPENKVYIYKREALEKPFGQNAPWQIINSVNFNRTTNISDVTNDGIADVVYANAIQVGEQGYDVNGVNTLRIRPGVWDGRQFLLDTEYRFSSIQLPTSTTYITEVNHVGEVGFDNSNDFIVSNIGWDQSLVPSAFLFANKSIDLYGIKEEELKTISTIHSQSAMPAVAQSGLWIYDMNNDGYADQIRLHSNSGSINLMVHMGKQATLDTDADGILDFVDLDKNKANIPMPHGAEDFDGDGIPYAVDKDALGRRDADNDAMTDAFEVMYGLNANSNEDADIDSDQDGFSNIQEYLNNTNPRVVDTPSNQQLGLLKQKQVFDGASISAVQFVDQMIVTASNTSPIIKLLNTVTLELVGELNTELVSGVSSLLVDGQRLFVGGNNGSIAIWNLDTQQALAADLDNANASIMSMSVNNSVLYGADGEGKVHRWNAETYAYLGVKSIGNNPTMYVQATNDYLITQMTATTKQLSVWNKSGFLNDGSDALRYSFNGSNDAGLKLSVTAGTDTHLAMAQHFDSSGIYLMDIKDSSSQVLTNNIQNSPVSSLELTETDVFVGYRDGSIQQVSIKNDSLRLTQATDNSAIKAIDTLNNKLITGHNSGKVFVWSVAHD